MSTVGDSKVVCDAPGCDSAVIGGGFCDGGVGALKEAYVSGWVHPRGTDEDYCPKHVEIELKSTMSRVAAIMSQEGPSESDFVQQVVDSANDLSASYDDVRQCVEDSGDLMASLSTFRAYLNRISKRVDKLRKAVRDE